MPVRDEHYWMGSHAMTLAYIASGTVEPKKLAGSALRLFLRERPPGCELAAMLRTTLNERKP